MPLEILKSQFSEFDLTEAFAHVTESSPYTLSIIEKYSDEILNLIQTGDWLSPLDYSGDCKYASELNKSLETVNKDQDCNRIIRRFRNLHSARILWHDLNGLADWRSVFKAQSDLADICSRAVLAYLEKIFSESYHSPVYADGNTMQLAIIAMGKWGGEELNFSSDIDFILLYAESGEVKGKEGRRDIEHHQYFTKISQRFTQIMHTITADGFVYRCDTRLRPFGDSGAPVVSLAAMEQYLTLHGREWERYAYLKARCVTGDTAVISDFEELRRPFVYRRYLDYGVFAKLRDMHTQIAGQVEKNDIKENIKLGRGGIRECEFLIQALQLLRGGRENTLQQKNFFNAYQALCKAQVWQDPGQKLIDAYIYLRLIENRLQGLHQQQTHNLPDAVSDQNLLSSAMQSENWSDVMSQLNKHRANVQLIFDEQMSLLKISGNDNVNATVSWRKLIQDTVNFSEQLKNTFNSLEKSRFYKNFKESSQNTLDQLLGDYLTEIKKRKNELGLGDKELEKATNNFLDIVHAIGKRSVYFNLLVERPAALKHLCDVCFTSDFLCRQIAQWPILLDELLDARIFSQAPTQEDLEIATQLLISNTQEADIERFISDLVVHKHVQSFRIAIAEIFKHLPLMKVSDRLSDLAELILQVVYTRVLKETLEKFDLPVLTAQDSGFAVLAYGKLGGLELSYSSDLDLVFLFDSGQLPASHPLSNDESLRTRFYARLVQQCLRFLNLPTSMGRLYEIDTRLRPSGNSGFLISSLSAFEIYQLEEAWVWEHQALSRARVILGSVISTQKISQIRKRILTSTIKHDSLKQDVINMRERMRQQFLKSNKEPELFHLKQSPGGMIDLEFLVQYLVLEHAEAYPEVIKYSDNIRQLESLAQVGVLSEKAAEELTQTYISLREIVHRRSLQDKKAIIPPDKVQKERDIVISNWHQFLA